MSEETICLRAEVEAFLWMQANDTPPFELEMFVDNLTEPARKPFVDYRFANCGRCAVQAMFAGSKADSLVIIDIVCWARDKDGLTADSLTAELDISCQQAQSIIAAEI